MIPAANAAVRAAPQSQRSPNTSTITLSAIASPRKDREHEARESAPPADAGGDREDEEAEQRDGRPGEGEHRGAHIRVVAPQEHQDAEPGRQGAESVRQDGDHGHDDAGDDTGSGYRRFGCAGGDARILPRRR